MLANIARGHFLVKRFGKFLLRFAPLWSVWLLVLLLPASREAARLQSWGSYIDLETFGQPWGAGRRGDHFDPRPLAKQFPHNANFAYWVHRWRVQGNEVNASESEEYLPSYAGDGGRDAIQLANRFPGELWLQALPLQYEMHGVDNVGYGYTPTVAYTAAHRASLIAIARRGQQREPHNAFWWLSEAITRDCLARKPRFTTNMLLQRASRCRFYDDKGLEARRRLVQVQSSQRRLSWEEKRALTVDALEPSEVVSNWGEGVAAYARGQQLHREYNSSLKICGALMRVGSLMSRGVSSPATVQTGCALQLHCWQGASASILFPLQSTVSMPRIEKDARRFAGYASVHGRSGIAREAFVNARYMESLWPWLKKQSRDYGKTGDYFLDHDGSFSVATTLRMVGLILIVLAVYLTLWWLVVNVFLWRSQGVPSVRRDRISSVLFAGAICLLCALASTWWFFLEKGATSPRSPRRDEVASSLAMFAFLSPPFLTALFCGVSTWHRNRLRWNMRLRMETELQLSSYSILLLRWFWPALLMVGVVGFLLSWLLWGIAIWADWSNIDLAPILLPDQNIYPGLLLWSPTDPITPAYCAYLFPLMIIVWFWKWRYAAPEMRPFTQSGVRWWKESLGGLVVFLSWLYLVVALGAWPIYQKLDTRLDQVLAKGELSFSPANSSSSTARTPKALK